MTDREIEVLDARANARMLINAASKRSSATGGTRIRDGVRSMNSESEYGIPIQSFMRDSFD